VDEKIRPPYDNDLMGAFICYCDEEQPEEKNTKKPKENSTSGTSSGSSGGTTVGETRKNCAVQQEACRARWGSGNDAFKQCMRTAGCSA
jgi:hypothetical protein